MERILLIDDSQFMRSRLHELLVAKGKTIVGEALNGKDGIEIYKKTNPDLVFLDINMPVLSGRDTLIQIRTFDPEAKIVMCSTLGDEDIISECIEEGAIYYVLKPFTKEAVEKALNEIEQALK